MGTYMKYLPSSEVGRIAVSSRDPPPKTEPTSISNEVCCVITDFRLDKITRESLYTQELRRLLQNKFSLCH